MGNLDVYVAVARQRHADGPTVVVAKTVAERFFEMYITVRDMPGSGKPAELLDAAGISARHIVDAVGELAGSRRGRHR